MGLGEARELLGGRLGGRGRAETYTGSELDGWRLEHRRDSRQTKDGEPIRGNRVTVEARGEGTTTLTARLDDGESATCDIYVQNSPVPVEEVRINKEEISILDGYTDVLTASVMPPHADFRHLTGTRRTPR